MSAKPEPDDLLCFSVYAAGNAFTQAYRPILAGTGLTYPQFLAMLLLWSRGALSVREIGQALYLDSGTLTPLLKRLEAQGLVKRARDREDERRVIVSPTPKGVAMEGQVAELLDQVLCATGLSHGEAVSLRDALRGLRARRAAP